MKKSIYLALSMVVAFGALASCGGKGDDCEHTYAAEWSSDVRGHWKAFTCDCEGLYPQVIAHVDSNNDGECDDCGYTGGHEHTYAAEWTAGENGHYHAATCGHDVKSEEVAHEENDIGKCVDCGATVSVLPITTVAEALEIANAQKKAVTHGTVEMENNGYYSSKDNAYYEFFEDYTYVSVKGDNGEKEGYYSLDKNGNIFAVENGELPSEEASEDMMNGYGFNLYYVWGDYGMVYGVEGLIEALYEKASEDYASYQENLEDAKLTEDEELIADVQYVIDNCGYSESVKDGVASFAFVYADGNGYAWKISVEFTLSEDYYIEEATVYSEKYEEFTPETKVVVKGDVEHEIDEKTATIYTFAEGAEASGTNEISIAQNPVIEEDNSNPYAPEKMLVTEFDLTNRADEEKVEDGAKLTVEVGTKIFLDVTVDNEKAAFSSMIFAIDDEVLTDAYLDERIALSHNKGFNWDTYQYENAVMMNTKQEGTYKVTLTYGEAIKNITVEVTPVATKSLKATAYVDYEWVEDVNIYTGMEIDVQVEANEYADASHTYAIVSDNADDMTFTANDDGTYTFTSKVAGTYEIKFTSTVNNEITDTLTIVVATPPTVAEILSGDYEYVFYGEKLGEATFAPESESAVKGTVTIATRKYDRNQGEWVTSTGVYSYAYSEEKISLTYVSGDQVAVSMSISESYELLIDGNVYTKVVEEEVSLAETLIGTWDNGEDYYLTFNEDGTFTIANALVGPSSTELAVYKYSIPGTTNNWGEEVINFELSENVKPLSITIVEMSYNSNDNEVVINYESANGGGTFWFAPYQGAM